MKKNTWQAAHDEHTRAILKIEDRLYEIELARTRLLRIVARLARYVVRIAPVCILTGGVAALVYHWCFR